MKGLEEAGRNLKAIIIAADDIIHPGLQRTAHAVSDGIKEEAKSRNWQNIMQRTSPEFKGMGHVAVVMDHPSAPALEYGTGIHGKRGAKYPIRPVHAKVLGVPKVRGTGEAFGQAQAKGFPIWTSPSGHQVAIIGKHVMHPGIKKQPFVMDGVERGKDRGLDEAGKEAFKGIKMRVGVV